MFARTPRLTLRPAWPEDAPRLAAAIGHEAVVTKLSRVPWPYTPDHAAEFLSRRQAQGELFCLILAHDAPAPRLIGGIGLHPTGEDTEIGYWLTPAAWGRGYATEAGRAVVDMARRALGLKRLVSAHHADNAASGRVLRKLGFHETGREQRPCLARGHDVTCAVLELDLATGARPLPIAA